MTAHMAEQYLEDSVVLGTMMLAVNDVDGLVSGAVHHRQHHPPGAAIHQDRAGLGIVSSVFSC